MNALRKAVPVILSAGVTAVISGVFVHSPNNQKPKAIQVMRSVRHHPVESPVWKPLVFNLAYISADLNRYRMDRSYWAYRGIAGASLARPATAISSWELPKRGESPEIANFQLALKALNGAMIAPGAQVSFNAIVGPRLQQRGYKSALMFSNGRVITGVGGGVCMASTALYNAALLAGLPIMERWKHSGAPSYAEPTRDSAVVFGKKDLRIKNNLPWPVWIVSDFRDGVGRVTLLSSGRPDYLVRLKNVGIPFIPSPLKLVSADAQSPEVLVNGAPGCNVKLIREYVCRNRVVKSEVICHDIRKPVDRVVAAPASVLKSPAVIPFPNSILEPVEPQSELKEKNQEPALPELYLPDEDNPAGQVIPLR